MHYIPLAYDEHEVSHSRIRSVKTRVFVFAQFSSYLNCRSPKYLFKKSEFFIDETRVGDRSDKPTDLEDVRFSHLASNLQTAYVEFNTVQDAEQWMNLTQVQTKRLDYSIILVSIDWRECRLHYHGRQ